MIRYSLALLIIFFICLQKAEATSNQNLQSLPSLSEPLGEKESATVQEPEPPVAIAEQKASKSLFDIIFGSGTSEDEPNANSIEKDSLITVEENKEGSFASKGTIKILDRTLGKLYLLDIEAGASKSLNEITIKLAKCWEANEKTLTAEARALLEIFENAEATQKKIFSGWMISNHPSVSFLEHAKYDVSLLRCSSLPTDEQTMTKGGTKKEELPAPKAKIIKQPTPKISEEETSDDEANED